MNKYKRFLELVLLFCAGFVGGGLVVALLSQLLITLSETF